MLRIVVFFHRNYHIKGRKYEYKAYSLRHKKKAKEKEETMLTLVNLHSSLLIV